jgi:hypothetical protein
MAWLMRLSLVIMKAVAAAMLLALVLVSPAYAILRPRLPHRTLPPQGGSAIVIVGDSFSRAQANSPSLFAR